MTAAAACLDACEEPCGTPPATVGPARPRSSRAAGRIDRSIPIRYRLSVSLGRTRGHPGRDSRQFIVGVGGVALNRGGVRGGCRPPHWR
jgi:hypothetical protein